MVSLKSAMPKGKGLKGMKEMARTANTRRSARPAPQPELTASNANAIVELGGTVNKAGRPNLFALRSAAKSGDIARKTALLSIAAQGLAEAAEIMSATGKMTNEARLIAEREALRLYEGRVDGSISADEVTETLGNVFGRKPLTSGPKAGQPGKTPAGLGEEIRKRIVRASQAAEYVAGKDGGRYFVGLPEDRIANIVQSLANKARSSELRLQADRALASEDETVRATAAGLIEQASQLEADALSIWSAYDYFAEVKTEVADSPVAMAFDPGKLAKLVEQLSVEGAITTVRASEPLLDVYAALYEILTVIGEPGPEEAEGGDTE